jgi:hypothetical protein
LTLLSSATTVWSLSSSFFQTTVSPTLMVSDAGYLAFLIVIVWVLAVRLVVGDFSAVSVVLPLALLVRAEAAVQSARQRQGRAGCRAAVSSTDL